MIDLRTLNPLDYEMIGESVKKTGKILIVHEDNKMNGPGAEISVHIAENYFDDLDAPIMRVASSDSHIPYNWHLEEKFLYKLKILKSLKRIVGVLMIIDIVMLKMGESITEGTILEWKKEIGEFVEMDEILLEIGTDKVDSEIPSPAAGK